MEEGNRGSKVKNTEAMFKKLINDLKRKSKTSFSNKRMAIVKLDDV